MYRSLYNYYNISRDDDVTARGLYQYYDIVEGQPTPLIYSISESRATVGQQINIYCTGIGYSVGVDLTNANRLLRSYGLQAFIGADACEITNVVHGDFSTVTAIIPTGAVTGAVTLKLTAPSTVTSNGIGLEIYEPVVGDDTGLELFLCDKTRPNTILCQLDGAFNKSFQSIVSQAGSGSFTIAKSDPKFPLILDQYYILCRLDGEDVFKWIIERIEPSLITADEQQLVSVSGRGVLSIMERVVVYPFEFPYQTDNARTFTDENAAYILKVLFDEALLRGAFYDSSAAFYEAVDLINGSNWTQPYVYPDFTLTTDSVGNTIDEDITISFSAGTPLSEVVNKLSDGMGLIDVEVTPDMKVKIYKISDVGTPRAIYRPGQAIVNMSYQRQSGDLTNIVLVEGQNGQMVEVSHAKLSDSWGRREGYLSAQNVASTTSALSTYGHRLLKKKSLNGLVESIQGTVIKFVDSQGVTLKPFETFKTGDWVTWMVPSEYNPVGEFDWLSIDWTKINWGGDVPTTDYYRQDVRVKAITVEENNDTGELLYTLDLNNLRLENEIKLKQQVDRLTKNSQNDSLSSGSTTTTPTTGAVVTSVRKYGDTGLTGAVKIKEGAGITLTQDDGNKEITVATNIKTINGDSILGSGDITVSGEVGPQGPKGDTGSQGIQGTTGANGADGADGVGVPINGTTGQVLAKKSNADYDTEWIDPPEGGSSVISLLDVYPIGAIYMSVVSTSPATLFGGTWSAWGSGRVAVGVDAAQTEFDTVEETGGAKTHTLSEGEMPSHLHKVCDSSGGATAFAPYTARDNGNTGSGTTTAWPANTTNTGGGGAHNNLQPYITCYMWKRTA